MSDSTSSPEDRPAPDAGPTDRSDRPPSDRPPSEAGDGPKKRRRGSRGGRNRSRSRSTARPDDVDRRPDDLPDRTSEGRPRDPAVAEKALVRRSEASGPGDRPRIGDSRPA